MIDNNQFVAERASCAVCFVHPGRQRIEAPSRTMESANLLCRHFEHEICLGTFQCPCSHGSTITLHSDACGVASTEDEG